MKPKLLAATLAAAAIFVLGTPAAHATIFVYDATLSGPSEYPPNMSPGTGWATVTYDDVAMTMRIEADFDGLTGLVTNAHIHCCTADQLLGTAGVATMTPTFTGFPSGVSSGSYDSTFDLTQASSFNPSFVTANGGTAASATAALFAGMDDGKAYFNIHTSVYDGGEIRGFLLPRSVPEPAALALLALGAAALAGAVHRRRGGREPRPQG